MSRASSGSRRAGLLVPLFSIPSRGSWGIGEIADLPRLGRWMSDAGFSFVQLLPINEMADGQNSPYSAMSAMAIDPIYIRLVDVPDYLALGGLGFFLGDGRLNYGPESTYEVFYRFNVWKRIWLSADYQFQLNPGYNRDRGPVNYIGLRLHTDF